jgi:hypothetical protein
MSRQSRAYPTGAGRVTARSLAMIAVVAAVILVAGVAVASAAPLEGRTLAPGQVTCTYRATFLADVTIPDNTVIPPGTTFVKTWRLRNDGNCAWGPGTTVDSMVFVGGTAMGNTGPVPLTLQVPPGQSANLSVTLTAPTATGTYRSDWKLHRTNGVLFGVGASSAPFYAQIKVNAGSTTAERITFASGATVWSKQGSITAPNRKEYVLRALAGQVMTVAIVSPKNVANFAITGVSDGQPYKRLENEDRFFTYTLPSTQDYLIAVAVPGGTAQYVLSIAVAPLP